MRLSQKSTSKKSRLLVLCLPCWSVHQQKTVSLASAELFLNLSSTFEVEEVVFTDHQRPYPTGGCAKNKNKIKIANQFSVVVNKCVFITPVYLLATILVSWYSSEMALLSWCNGASHRTEMIQFTAGSNEVWTGFYWFVSGQTLLPVLQQLYRLSVWQIFCRSSHLCAHLGSVLLLIFRMRWPPVRREIFTWYLIELSEQQETHIWICTRECNWRPVPEKCFISSARHTEFHATLIACKMDPLQ